MRGAAGGSGAAGRSVSLAADGGDQGSPGSASRQACPPLGEPWQLPLENGVYGGGPQVFSASQSPAEGSSIGERKTNEVINV